MTNIPIVNAGQKYVEGLEVSFNSTSKIDVASGQARDSSNTNDIVLDSSVTIDASVNGANGLDTGSLANNTIYAVYAIGDSTQNKSSAAQLSTDLSAPVLPFNYDMHRRIGFVRTDGSANLLKFFAYGSGRHRIWWYDVARSVLSGGSDTSFTKIDLSADMPSITTQVMLDLVYTPNLAANVAEFRNVNSGASTGQVRFGYGVASAQTGMAVVPAGLDSGSVKIEYKVVSSDALDVNLQGWQDYL